MKRMVVMIAGILLLTTGCATTKWECPGNDCIDYHRAVNKCLAQANSAFAKSYVKQNIWSQCMQGEGYILYRCEDDEAKYNSKCKFMHVF